jgi:regulator of RNase E activity RraB
VGLFRKIKKVHNENWRAWDFFNNHDEYGLITYDVTYLEPNCIYSSKAEFVINLLIPDKWSEDGNFPTPEGHHKLIEFEDKLISKLEKFEVDCIQVIRLTHNGTRTFVFEVNDIVKFLETIKIWIGIVRDFEIKIEKQEPWTYYHEWEPDDYNWQQIGNQQVIEQLITHGSNPEKLHKLEFSFGGKQTNLELLKSKLLSEEGKFLLMEDNLLEIEFESSLDNHEIDPLTFFLFDTANEFGCKYEGWRASIVK